MSEEQPKPAKVPIVLATADELGTEKGREDFASAIADFALEAANEARARKGLPPLKP